MPVEILDKPGWVGRLTKSDQPRALAALEAGAVLLFPSLAFELRVDERRFLGPSTADGESKNISFDPLDGQLSGSACRGEDRADLVRLMQRFANAAHQLVEQVAPGYAPRLDRARTSFRPIAVEGRRMPPISDDTRLHVDAFPSRPTAGRRILRVFANVSPDGMPRVWKLGPPFEELAARFLPQVRRPLPGRAWLLERSGQTRGRRTPYDHYMLGVHDAAKLDADFQRRAPATEHAFAAGATWMVFSDVATHAALAGQFVLEQTFHLPIAAMQHEDLSPLRVLERRLGRRLA